MANLLSMATIDAILTLRQRNWSIRRIAKELGLHRDTVARHLQLHQQAAQSSQPTLPDASAEAVSACKIGHPSGGADDVQTGHPCGGAGDVQTGQAPIGAPAPPARAEQASLCEPYRAIIETKLAAGLTAQRIFQGVRPANSVTLFRDGQALAAAAGLRTCEGVGQGGTTVDRLVAAGQAMGQQFGNRSMR